MQMNLASGAHGIGAATSGTEKTSCNKYYFSLSVNTTCLASTRQCFDGKLMRSSSIPKGTSAAAAMHSRWIQISPTALSSHNIHTYWGLKTQTWKHYPRLDPKQSLFVLHCTWWLSMELQQAVKVMGSRYTFWEFLFIAWF